MIEKTIEMLREYKTDNTAQHNTTQHDTTQHDTTQEEAEIPRVSGFQEFKLVQLKVVRRHLLLTLEVTRVYDVLNSEKRHNALNYLRRLELMLTCQWI